MGRPKKNRRKTPEEKEQHGVKSITRAGVTMHCSVCGNPNHNKKGHAKWVLDNLNGATNVEDEDVDDPSVMQHLMPITPDPRNDPMHQMRTLVHQMGQEGSGGILSRRSVHTEGRDEEDEDGDGMNWKEAVAYGVSCGLGFASALI
ncbi:hypothetical protein QYE76_030355 [Lolium multiflorum]|uniref:Uncharacterized protein n=1 Tax=Lolium multiflorum TaxID=4521 RepID=A0AAD8QQ81_LOLMU|nr:hypothetical protein QYE76_030355 [Lolium multiflorum]